MAKRRRRRERRQGRPDLARLEREAIRAVARLAEGYRRLAVELEEAVDRPVALHEIYGGDRGWLQARGEALVELGRTDGEVGPAWEAFLRQANATADEAERRARDARDARRSEEA